VSFVGFFSLLLAPAVGLGFAEAVSQDQRSAPQQATFPVDRSRHGTGRGGLTFADFGLDPYYRSRVWKLLGFIWPIVYAVIVSTTVLTRLSGIQIK
jgi:hypothetical protein